MTIIVLDGQGGGIGRAIISALLPLLPQGAQLLCVGTNAMATAAMLKAGAQRGATGENAVRWAAQNADILIAPIALVLKDSMMGEITGDMAASVGSSRATRILVPTERCGTHVAGAHGVSIQAFVEDAARQAAPLAAGAWLWPFCITFGLTLHSYCLIIKRLKPGGLQKGPAGDNPFAHGRILRHFLYADTQKHAMNEGG